MFKLLFDAFVYVFALYGLVTLLGNFIDRFEGKIKNVRTSYKLIITVKDQEDSIEGIIRSIFKDELFKDKAANASVLVIDKGSTDDTVKILRKLQEVYENLEVLQEMGG